MHVKEKTNRNNRKAELKKATSPKLKLKELTNTNKMKALKGGGKKQTSCAGCVGHTM